MKSNNLSNQTGGKNPLYKRLQGGFSEWLRILNFEQSSQRDMPKMLDEFLHYLIENNCNQISGISESHIQNYLGYLAERPSKTLTGGLSQNYIRKHLQVIKKFARYLAESNQESFEVKIKLKGKQHQKHTDPKGNHKAVRCDQGR